MLFAIVGDGTPLLLKDANKLFAWLDGQFGDGGNSGVCWTDRGTDVVSKGVFLEAVANHAQAYDTIESVPHEPPLPTSYYNFPTLPTPTGRDLDQFVNLFNPATDVDRDLIRSFLLTLAWGGEGGTRPVFLVTAADEDESGGRGVGKTTLVRACADLFGGLIEADLNTPVEELKTRFLSEGAAGVRVCLMDNVKTNRISSSGLEALVTARDINGKRLYRGDGRRPNTVCYAITVNGGLLSKDMATRSVTIQLARPKYDPAWDEQVRYFTTERRWHVVSDIIAALKAPASIDKARKASTRWATWEASVLARVTDPEMAKATILARQADMDDEQGEAEDLRNSLELAFETEGVWIGNSYLFLPTSAVLRVVSEVMGKQLAPREVRALLKQMVPSVKDARQPKERGYKWHPERPNLKIVG